MKEKETKKVKKTTATVAKNTAKKSATTTKAEPKKAVTTTKTTAKTAKVEPKKATKATAATVKADEKTAAAKKKTAKVEKKSNNPVENYLNNLGGSNNAPKYKITSTIKKEEAVQDIVKRLNRVAGQLSGVIKMVESGRFCMDIMIQICACEKSLIAVSDKILKEHLENYLSEDSHESIDNIIAETMDLIKIMR